MKGLIAAGLALLSSGCATIVTGGGNSQSVSFTSEPSGALVYVDDNFVGKTPVATTLTRHDDHFVRMNYLGNIRETTIKPGANPWILGNILFGGIIGCAVDIGSGAIISLRPGDVKCTFDNKVIAHH